MTTVPAATPLRRVTLADQVRDYIVLEITQGRIAPGAALRELEVAQQLGTSQTPVREAFRELAALGLLESKIHVGTRVRTVAEQDLLDAVPVRAALEGLAGRFVAARSAEAAEPVRRAFDAMVDAAATGDRLAYASSSTTFHRTVINETGNESLMRAWNALGIEVMTIMSVGSTVMPLMEAAQSHLSIVVAIESGDPELAAGVLAEHVSGYLPATPHETSVAP